MLPTISHFSTGTRMLSAPFCEFIIITNFPTSIEIIRSQLSLKLNLNLKW